MSSEARALKLENVARRFARRWVLRGINLEMNPGESVALMGRNGSGKTTLLRVIATSLRPTRGQGWVFGQHLVDDADEVREFVGTLGHHAGLYDDLTASENLVFSMHMYGLDVPRSKIVAALEEVGLGAEVKERVRGFSAGMRRRLALARLILRTPKILLLDEPYAAFDQHGIDQVNDFIRRVLNDGGTALIATHDLRRTSAVAQRVVRIVDGKIAFDGSTSSVLAAEDADAISLDDGSSSI